MTYYVAAELNCNACSLMTMLVPVKIANSACCLIKYPLNVV